jgi:hypothetical protein
MFVFKYPFRVSLAHPLLIVKKRQELPSMSIFPYIIVHFTILVVYSSTLKKDKNFPPKRWYLYAELCGVTYQKTYPSFEIQAWNGPTPMAGNAFHVTADTRRHAVGTVHGFLSLKLQEVLWMKIFKRCGRKRSSYVLCYSVSETVLKHERNRLGGF